MKKQTKKHDGQPVCPHCGGTHYGQRFDDCPIKSEGTCPDCGGPLDENDECPDWYESEGKQ